MRGCGLPGESDESASVDGGTLSATCASDHRRHGVGASGRACDTGEFMSNSGALPRSQHSSCSATSVAACLCKAHSQTVATRQPARSRSCRLRRSRSVFPSNLARQNPWRVDGVVAYGQPACRCQKHPSTRHTAPNRRNTRSGVPGSLRSCRRYRSPRAWMARRKGEFGSRVLASDPSFFPADKRALYTSGTRRRTDEPNRAHSRFPGHALTPTGVMAIRCKQFHLPDL